MPASQPIPIPFSASRREKESVEEQKLKERKAMHKEQTWMMHDRIVRHIVYNKKYQQEQG